jgi:hypothetical protein
MTTSTPDPFGERVELGEPGLRCERLGHAALAKDAEQDAHLVHRLSPGALDACKCLPGCVGIAREDTRGRRRLDRHHTDVVRHDIVELVRNAHALCLDSRLGPGISFGRELGRELLELFGPQPP